MIRGFDFGLKSGLVKASGFGVMVSMMILAQDSVAAKYTGLNDYVIKAPNQGDVNTCLFMASTGAMEILLNKSLGIKDPKENGPTDLSERYLISERVASRSRSWFEDAFLKFDSGRAILNRDLPFESFTEEGDINNAVWGYPQNFDRLPRISLPKVDTVFLFSVGNKYSRGVLNSGHVDIIKQALLKYESPVVAVGNDEDYWHVTVITGFDDDLEGDCYGLDSKVCRGKKGVFYVRDSFGNGLETRSYEWLIRRNNAAMVAKLAEGKLPN